MQQIEKMYGKGSIMRYGAESTLNVESIPTGSLSLDLALGIGGLPRGRIVEIYGPESSGKTTLALHVLAEADFVDEGYYFIWGIHMIGRNVLTEELFKRLNVPLDVISGRAFKRSTFWCDGKI